MSGAEAIAILGLISSVITIIDKTKNLHDAASDTKGLPQAFREVAARLPTVQNILGSAKQHIKDEHASEDSCKGAKGVVISCDEKAQKLEQLFQKVLPAEGASRAKRYYSALRTLGKEDRVEKLMEGILKDVQLLAIDHSMVPETAQQREEVADAIEEIAALPSSTSEQEETGFTATHSGSGAINQVHGDQYSNPGSGQFYHAHSMNFGSNVDPEEACLVALFQALRTDPRDDRAKLVQRKGTRVDGTCSWIKSDPLYSSWLRSRSQLLWLSGGPGKGKTMLSMFLTEELEQIAQNSQNTSVLYFFCDNKDETRNTAESVIRGLLFQLLQIRRQLFHHILPTFKMQKESLFTSSSFEALWRVFHNSICDPLAGTIYCVIDGLDECDEQFSEILLARFKSLFLAKSNILSSFHLNLVVVSRESPDFIAESLIGFPQKRLDPDADCEINHDIGRFIDVKVDDLALRKQYPNSLSLRVKQVFHERAGGTFLWVGSVAKMLSKYKATEVEKALELFPPGLDDIYARILLQIDINRREIVAKILRWVVLAVRPLTLAELGAALELPIEPTPTFTYDEMVIDQVSQCGYLLTIEECEVRLIHQSAKEYLLREGRDTNPDLEYFRIQKTDGNLEIATKCLAYLHGEALARGPVNLKKDLSHEAFPLLKYAAISWPEHARSLSHSAALFDLSRPFFREHSLLRDSWLETYESYHRVDSIRNDSRLLHVATWFGILPLVQKLLLQQEKVPRKGIVNFFLGRLSPLVNQTDAKRRTPLHIAAERGHLAVVQLLLEKGANVHAKASKGITALHEVSREGHLAVVKLLLEGGANIHAKYGNAQTALHEAAFRGHYAVVQLLLEKGAKIYAKDDSARTALHKAAIHNGHYPVVQLLLANGANINAKNKHGITALHDAAHWGNMEVVRLLIEKGANLDAQDKHSGTALHHAASLPEEEVVQLLCEKGADISARNRSGETALHIAASNALEKVVQTLLANGGDPEVKDDLGRTAQNAAAVRCMQALFLLKTDLVGPQVIDNEKMRRRAQESYKGDWCRSYDPVLRLLGHEGLFVD